MSDQLLGRFNDEFFVSYGSDNELSAGYFHWLKQRQLKVRCLNLDCSFTDEEASDSKLIDLNLLTHTELRRLLQPVPKWKELRELSTAIELNNKSAICLQDLTSLTCSTLHVVSLDENEIQLLIDVLKSWCSLEYFHLGSGYLVYNDSKPVIKKTDYAADWEGDSDPEYETDSDDNNNNDDNVKNDGNNNFDNNFEIIDNGIHDTSISNTCSVREESDSDISFNSDDSYDSDSDYTQSDNDEDVLFSLLVLNVLFSLLLILL